VGSEEVAKSDRAASTVVSVPRSSSVSTSLSRASSASCTSQMKANIRSYFKRTTFIAISVNMANAETPNLFEATSSVLAMSPGS
jgi:hypothetical protein